MTKIIVDTSVWIDFFKGRLNSTVRQGMEIALEKEQVAITDIIQHEILMGASSKKEWTLLTELLSPLEFLRIQSDQLKDFNQFAWRLRLQGLEGRYTDATIAYLSSIHKYPILSLDQYFKLLDKKDIVSIITF